MPRNYSMKPATFKSGWFVEIEQAKDINHKPITILQKIAIATWFKLMTYLMLGIVVRLALWWEKNKGWGKSRKRETEAKTIKTIVTLMMGILRNKGKMLVRFMQKYTVT